MNIRRDVFQAIADPTRRAILTLLASQSLTAGAIAANFDSARPTISKHIQILVECELLSPEQRGREIYYQLQTEGMKEIGEWLKPFQELWENRFARLDKILKQMKKTKK